MNVWRAAAWRAGWLALGLAAAGCGSSPSAPEGALMITQTPLAAGKGGEGATVLDVRYPPGSRVVLVARPGSPGSEVLLSAGLVSAGDPAVAPDGGSVLFAGKAGAGDRWQIYRAAWRGGRPVRMTDEPGGATGPAWLPAGRFAFSSPVPSVGGATGVITALFAQSLTGGPPTRLTFGRFPATDATVLRDGRILFVTSVPREEGAGGSSTSLFTVNNDGTEVSPFAGQHDAPAALRRPRESADGRVMFLAGGTGAAANEGRIEQVLMARPFRSRSIVFPSAPGTFRAAEPLADGSVLVTWLDAQGSAGGGSFAVYRLGSGDTFPERPEFDDPAWHEVEAVSATPPARPMGRLSNVDASRSDAVLLCLDVRESDPRLRAAVARAARVRFFRHAAGSAAERLGEAALHEDGSFLVRVPADVPLGIELVDAGGRTLGRCPPAFWLRPGENRSCVGCHEPHNRAPENVRPLAVRSEPVALTGAPGVAGPK